MIERAEIRNWQSLRKVDLDFGRFTVIVGASSSGKTAFMRAMRGLASNVRGTGTITRGQKSCAITVRTGDTTIALERAEGSGSYKVLKDGQVTAYTKLAGSVPPQVTEALRIAPVPTGGTSINFAGQFDKPFLLDESGSHVARELGELTNVNVVFEAVREANKRRNVLAADLKSRRRDLDECITKAATYSELPGKLAKVAEAELIAETASQLTDRVNRLRQAIDQLRIAEQVLARSAVPEIPDNTRVTQTKAARDLLAQLLDQRGHHLSEVERLNSVALHATRDEARVKEDLTQLLHDAGKCPTCGQSTA